MRKNGVKHCLLIISFVFAVCSILLLENKEEKAKNVFISEVVTSNGTVIYDSNYQCPDWVELYNSGEADVNLGNFRLTWNHEDIFVFPERKIPAGETMIVYFMELPEKYENTEIYTGFTLGKFKEGILTLTDSMGKTIDNMEIPVLDYDEAYGRKNSNGDEVGILAYATPGEVNCLEFKTQEAELGTIKFSHQGGVYEASFYLTLEAASEDKIYYTLDGTIPDENSLEYQEPILISDPSASENQWTKGWLSLRWDENIQMLNSTPCKKAVVIRARIQRNGEFSSKTITRTYFVNAEYTLPVVSLTAPAEQLFDENEGLMVVGNTYQKALEEGEIDTSIIPGTLAAIDHPGNYERDSTLQGYVEVYDVLGNELVSEDIYLKLSGAGSRANPGKSFKVISKKTHENDLWEDSFVLRTTSGEVDVNMLADTLVTRVANDMGLSENEKQPCILFLNGEYWGIYYITQNRNVEFFEKYYDLDKKEIQIVKYDAYNKSRTYAGEHAREEFLAFVDFVEENNMSNQIVFEQAQKMLDMENFCDYLYLNLFFWNTDWPQNNVMAWRFRAADNHNEYADGKWRFYAYDFDDSLINWYENTIETRLSKETDIGRLFWGLMENQDFSNMFFEGFEECLESVFLEENLQKILLEENEKISKELPEYFSRWKMQYQDWYLNEYVENEEEMTTSNPQASEEYYKKKLKSAMKFLHERRTYLEQDFQEVKSKK